MIFERVWGYDFGFASNSLDVYIGYLRRKTEAGGKPRLIQTVRGVGYALREAMSFRRAGSRSCAAAAVALAVVARVGASSTSSSATSCAAQVDDDACSARRADPSRRRPPELGTDRDGVPRRPARLHSAALSSRSSTPTAASTARPASGVRCRSTDAHARRGSRGERTRSSATPRSTARTSACSRPSGAGCRAPDRAAARRGRPRRSHRIRLVPDPDRGRRHRASPLRSGLLVARAALAPVRRLTETTERVTETRDLSQRIEVDGRGRARPARRELQHDARRARGLEPRPAAARRRRLARAAHAAHEPADEHRGPRARATRCRRRSASSCCADVVEQLGEMTALIGELIELARDDEQQAREARGRAARPDRRRTRSSAPGATGPSVAFSTDLERVARPRRAPSTIERADREPARQRRQVEPARRRRSRSASATARSPCATTAPGSPRRTCRYVFDRFYRARTARGMPGSGLGLAIVQAGRGGPRRPGRRRARRGRRHAHAPAAERPQRLLGTFHAPLR